MNGLQIDEPNEHARKTRNEQRQAFGTEDEMLQIWDDFDGYIQLTPSQALQLLDYLQGQAETLRSLQE